MICRKCKQEISDEYRFCPYCGADQQKQPSRKRRGNGQGTAYREANGTWTLVRIFGFESRPDGSIRQIRGKRRGFKTKAAALASFADVTPPVGANVKKKKPETFSEIYEAWLPTHARTGVSRSTLSCYKAAYSHFSALYEVPFCEISIDDLQECLDDCDKGKRTRQLMKITAGLMYKYAIPRGIVENVNMAQYLHVSGEASVERPAFSDLQIEQIRRALPAHIFARYIYCMIYLGYRPHEFITLDSSMYSPDEHLFVHGIKTEAGKGRTVTVSPKIQPLVDEFVNGRSEGPLVTDEHGKPYSDKKFRETFYETLDELDIVAPPGKKFTPHCCRHTFATLIKNIKAPDKDKLELIGHTSIKMLAHYQHSDLASLRAITDAL